jgi:hypothetical protein
MSITPNPVKTQKLESTLGAFSHQSFSIAAKTASSGGPRLNCGQPAFGKGEFPNKGNGD